MQFLLSQEMSATPRIVEGKQAETLVTALTEAPSDQITPFSLEVALAQEGGVPLIAAAVDVPVKPASPRPDLAGLQLIRPDEGAEVSRPSADLAEDQIELASGERLRPPGDGPIALPTVRPVARAEIAPSGTNKEPVKEPFVNAQSTADHRLKSGETFVEGAGEDAVPKPVSNVVGSAKDGLPSDRTAFATEARPDHAPGAKKTAAAVVQQSALPLPAMKQVPPEGRAMELRRPVEVEAHISEPRTPAGKTQDTKTLATVSMSQTPVQPLQQTRPAHQKGGLTVLSDDPVPPPEAPKPEAATVAVASPKIPQQSGPVPVSTPTQTMRIQTSAEDPKAIRPDSSPFDPDLSGYRHAGLDSAGQTDVKAADGQRLAQMLARPDVQKSVLAQLSRTPLNLDQPVELRLDPQELGQVRMVLSTSDQIITLSLSAERPETLELMRRNIDQLARDFQDLGYTELNFSFEDTQSDGAEVQDPHPEVTPENTTEVEQIQPPQVLELGVATGLDIRI